MADKPPVAAAVQPTIPRRRNRRRQQSEGNRRHSIWQASDAHASGSASAEPAWPDQSVREGWAAASAADVDGWTVTAEDRDKLLEKSLWTLDRGNTMIEERDYPTCLLCCEQFKVVAFGQCGHKEICADCIFQMVMLYQNSKCPLCKAELNQIVITHWPGPDTGSLSDWKPLLEELWHDCWWSAIFYIAHTNFPGTSQPLHAHFQQLTATACSVCDPQTNNPFQTDSALCKHMIRRHHRHLCRLCLRARQQAFPLQQPTYTAPELHAHMAADHPQCRFCGTRFLDEERYGLHMMAAHPYCELCDDDFRDAAEFTEHLRSEHWLCQEPACQGCFVAFESKEDLIFHQRTVHAFVDPQQNSSGEEQIMAVNAFRPLLLDLSLQAPTFYADASVAALMAAIHQVNVDLRSSTANLQSSTANLQSISAILQSSTADLQRSEHLNSSSAPGSRSHNPSSTLPRVPQQQQQQPPQVEELGSSVTFTLARLFGSTEPTSHTAQSSSRAGNLQGRAGQPHRLAAASQQGPASAGAGSTVASGGGDAERSRPLSQAEIDERIASRRVQPYVHRGSLAAQQQHRDAVQQTQPAHTVGDQSAQTGMEQLEQLQESDRTFLAVIHRAILSDGRSLPAVSHVASSVRAPSQGTDPAAALQEPQGSDVGTTGPPDLSNSASGWD